MNHPLRPIVQGAACALLLSLAACGGNSNPAAADPPTPPSDDGPPPSSATVQVQDFVFAPANIVVAPGATITWNWAGSTEHNVTWSGVDLQNSPTQVSGSHQVQMPGSTGTRVYFCTIHGTPTGGMRGTITVGS
jgi:plastocyanin